MAKDTSNGLTYFNIDCVEQDNLEYVQLIHGIIGYGVLIKLWRKIYQVEGYFCKWDEKTILHFAKKEVDVDLEEVKKIVETCLDEGIFSREKYQEYQVLTSDGIQKRWLKIVTEAKRKNRVLEPTLDLIKKTPEYLAKTPEESEKTPEEDIQSKVKESKENKSKETHKELCEEELKISKEILADFGFNEIANFDKLRLITAFIKVKKNSARLDYFLSQYLSYKKYKELSFERKHNFTSFFGTQENQFEDGKWDEANWDQKIIEFKTKAANTTHGKANQGFNNSGRGTNPRGTTFLRNQGAS